ncbi:MAG: hypothetical protein CMJ90_11295 [Planctomycetes bacterium]|nr:hypothetical protein [Planctomycetota bacterium]
MTQPARGDASRGALLAAATLSGAGVMVVELTAARALAPWFGASLYVWTNVIGVVLLALAAGYWFGGRLADRRPEPRFLGRILLVAAALSLPAPFLTGALGQWLLPDPEAMSPFVATDHVVTGSLVVTLLLFAPPIMLLGMVGPFVTRCLVDTGLDGGTAAGRTLAVSTLGSLGGTYLPAHFLIEEVGVRATLLIASGLFVLAALVLLARGRGTAVATGMLLAIGGLAAWGASMPIRPTLPTADADKQTSWHEAGVLEEIETAYQYVRVSRWQDGRTGKSELRLSLDEGVTEFHSIRPDDGYLTGKYYDHFALLPELFADRADKPVDVIVLGGGAGTMGRTLRGLHGDAVRRVLCVEIDPKVAALHDRFGWSPSAPDAMLVGDARVILASADTRFDLIILDAYAKQIAIPAHLGTVEFFRLVSQRLTFRGVFAINVSAPDLGGPLMRALITTLKEVFPTTAVACVPGSWNVVLLAATDAERDLQPKGGIEALDDVREGFLAGLLPAPEPGDGAQVLLDDRAPLERLARSR